MSASFRQRASLAKQCWRLSWRKPGWRSLAATISPKRSRIFEILWRRCPADKLHLVAIRVVNVHGPACQDRVLSRARAIACLHERRVLGVERLFRQFQRQMIELIARWLRLDLLRLGNQDYHLGDSGVALANFQKDVRQRGRRNHLQSQQITVKLERLLLVVGPENNFRDANNVFHRLLPLSSYALSSRRAPNA